MFFHEPFGGIIPGPRGRVLAALLRTGSPVTGRQVHRLVSPGPSLWTVQRELSELEALGLLTTETVGRARRHSINEEHAAVGPLRTLLDPIGMLSQISAEAAGEGITAVMLFGSIARGEAEAGSDIDLAIIAPSNWDRRADVAEAVRAALGNPCDVIHLTPDAFIGPVDQREPVVGEVLRDGIVLTGALPRPRREETP